MHPCTKKLNLRVLWKVYSRGMLCWTSVLNIFWTIAENLFKQSLGKEEQCALWRNFTELLRLFIFVNKAIYSRLQNNFLSIQRGKQPELIIVQYRINGQREEDFNTLKSRNNCEINFCRIYFCDLRPWSQKCLAKWRKSYFSSENPMILKENIQNAIQFTKFVLQNLYFGALN